MRSVEFRKKQIDNIENQEPKLKESMHFKRRMDS